MTWFRVDDSLPDHPKLLALQGLPGWHRALALWTLAGAWCGRHNTDGRVPGVVVSRLGCRRGDATALVLVGLWLEDGNDYVFHAWAERNPTRAQVEADRVATRERVAKYRKGNGAGNAVTPKVANGVSTPPPSRPDPTRPDPTQRERDAREPDEPDEPDEPKPPQASASPPGWLVVAKSYQRRWEASTATAWQDYGAHRTALEAVWRWCRAQSAIDSCSPEDALERLLDAFWRDAWATSKRWPLAHLSREAGKYYAETRASTRALRKTRIVCGVEYDDTERDEHNLTAAERAHNQAIREFRV
jgi:hypothetical protein